VGAPHAPQYRVEEARRPLSAYLSGTSAGRELLRAYERDSERAEGCLRDHVGPALEAFLRGGVLGAGAWSRGGHTVAGGAGEPGAMVTTRDAGRSSMLSDVS
jgi:hypothetical protein